LAVIENTGKAPFAYLKPGGFSFSEFAAEINARDPAAAHEKLVWQLASVLFDPVSIPEELEQVPDIANRLRKEHLSSFWQKLVEDASNTHTAMARSNEEKAIACLAGHKVADACAHLVNSGDYHLATLVALIGSKDSMRKDMREQLNDWQKSRVLSEFSEPIRAIYELLAGNVCICNGSKGPEDRMQSFVISKRFGLDWRQAFGLRLWYGISSGESITPAVAMFSSALKDEKETSRPQAWYFEQKVPALWDDKSVTDREDLLWGLLKLFALDNVGLEGVLRPENSQLSPLDIRLSWQLSQTLSSCGAVRFPADDADAADRLTLSFASQLTSEGSWVDATFVLLHLTQEDARAKAVQNHLAHHAGRIGNKESPAFDTLTQTFKIPAAWVWEAKALHMRSVEKNPRAEVECLIYAGSYNEAHSTFAKEVAPRAIVELDYDTLRVLLVGFEGKESSIAEWHLGGEIYQDYLRLLDCDKKGGVINHAVLQRLLSGLPAVVEESRHPAFMETVAVETMSGVVAKSVVAQGKIGEVRLYYSLNSHTY
jgi:nuclear pore complex protein Nup98-Nup96